MKRGQATAELAILAPFLLLLVLGSIDLTNAYLQRIAIADSAREGARFGIRAPGLADASSQPPVSNDPNNIKARVKGELANVALTVADSDITITWIKSATPPAGCSAIATTSIGGTYLANPTCFDFIKIDVVHTYTPLTPVIANLLGSGVTLKASATGRIQ
jgi:hypothetical protein